MGLSNNGLYKEIKWENSNDKFYAIKFFNEFENHTRYNDLTSFEKEELFDIIKLNFIDKSNGSVEIDESKQNHIKSVPVTFGKDELYMKIYFVSDIKIKSDKDIYWIYFNDATTRYPSIILFEESFREILLDPFVLNTDCDNLKKEKQMKLISDILPDLFKYMYMTVTIDGVNAPGVEGFLNTQQTFSFNNNTNKAFCNYGNFNIDKFISHAAIYNVYQKAFNHKGEDYSSAIMRLLLKEEYGELKNSEKVIDTYVDMIEHVNERKFNDLSYLKKQIYVLKNFKKIYNIVNS